MYLDLQGVQDYAEMILLQNTDLKKIPDLKQSFYGAEVIGMLSA
ncbi:hypothetical protein [Candidatus Coxiella mudrowiae]|nr:hypothetical protein [Candidatus Coxiella mudrowiae]